MSNSSAMTPTFHGFLKLPKEIQLMIWENHEGNETRVITIKKRLDHQVVPPPISYHVHASPALPIQMQLNREVRADAMRSYKPMFGFNNQPPVYFNVNIDLLQLEEGCDWEDAPAEILEDLRLVRKLEVLDQDCGNLEEVGPRMLPPFASLQFLTARPDLVALGIDEGYEPWAEGERPEWEHEMRKCSKELTAWGLEIVTTVWNEQVVPTQQLSERRVARRVPAFRFTWIYSKEYLHW